MQSRKMRKRAFIVAAGVIFSIAAGIGVSALFPRFMTGLLFGVNTAPVKLSVSDTHSPRETDEKTIAIVTAADSFLSSLSTEQKQAATYAFSDNRQRSNWSNFPEGMIPRGGLKMAALSETQQTKLDSLLAEIMSAKGIQNLKFQLAAEETFPKGSFNKYGVEYFYVAFLGEPSTTKP